MKKLFTIIAFSVLAHCGIAQNLGNWQALGPINFPPDISGQINGIGRCTQIKFDPTNSNTIYVTSASGGVWKSVNNGQNWAVLGTDVLTSLACASICIDYSNPNILYLGTGDPNYYSNDIGMMKSIDGGATWQSSNTGIGNKMPVEILMLPTDHNTLLAAANGGIYKSTNAGANWTAKQTGGTFTDMIFKPGTNGQTVYACTHDSFYRSLDAGETWSLIAYPDPNFGGIPTGLRIGVSAANASVVYLAGIFDPGGDNYCAVYKSTNSGGSFTGVFTNNDLNLTGYDETSGGQGNYDFDITVDPTNSSKVYVVAHCVWRSDDAGTSWTKYTDWWADCHTDMHHIVHSPGDNSMILNANDGGIFVNYDEGDTWEPYSDGLAATEIYHAAQSPIRRDMISIGTQDNGELYYQQGTDWVTNRGGDWGSRMAFDYANSTRVYYYENNNRRDVTGSEDALNTPVVAGNETEYEFNPLNTSLCFMGDTGIYRTTNLNLNPPGWTEIGNINQHILALGSSQATVSLLYALADDNKVYRSLNATAGNPTFTSYNLPEAIDVRAFLSPIKSNQNVVYAAIDRHVYRSGDQGATWTDVTGTLPSINCRGMVHDVNSTDESIYLANAKSVFYKNNTMSDWINYSNGLPLIADIRDLMVYNNNTSNNILRVSFYGRGVWESAFYNAATAAPFANFSADTLTGCPGLVVHYTDASNGDINSWAWQFPGGIPATSSAQNPTVSYPSGGMYDATLTVSGANGSNTQTETGYINIISTQAIPLVEGFEGNVFPPAGWRLEGTDLSSNWQAEGSVGGYGTSFNCIKFDNFGYDANGAQYSFITTGIDFSTVGAASLSFDVAYALYTGYNDSLEVLYSTDCGQTTHQIYLKGGVDLTTAPDYTAGGFVPAAGEWRTETIDVSNLADNASVAFYWVNHGHYSQNLYVDNINIQEIPVGLEKIQVSEKPSISLFPNPSNGQFSLAWKNMQKGNLAVKVMDISGKEVYDSAFEVADSKRGQAKIDLSQVGSGIYILRATMGDKSWNMKVAVR